MFLLKKAYYLTNLTLGEIQFVEQSKVGQISSKRPEPHVVSFRLTRTIWKVNATVAGVVREFVAH